MARLRIFRRAAGREFPVRNVLLNTFNPGPEFRAELERQGIAPIDDIERTTSDVRMWWRADDRLAYGPRIPFPVVELPLLMTDEEHNEKMRG